LYRDVAVDRTNASTGAWLDDLASIHDGTSSPDLGDDAKIVGDEIIAAAAQP